MSVSKRLKELRLEQGLSVAELAAAAGVSKPYIWQIESGRRQNPGAEKLQCLASALGVTIADLIGAKEGIPAEALDDVPASLIELVRNKGKKLP